MMRRCCWVISWLKAVPIGCWPNTLMRRSVMSTSLEGLSEREACDRLLFDLRWKAAAGLAVSAGSFTRGAGGDA